MSRRSALERAQGQIRLAWLAVVVAGAVLAGAREQLRRVAGEHEAECQRLHGQMDGALEHISRLQRETDAADGDLTA